MGCFGFLPGRILKGVRHISAVLINSETIDSASADARLNVPRFSKVINFRLCRIGKETFSAKTVPVGHRCRCSSCIEFSAQTEGEGICFEFMLWIFDEFLQSCFVHVRGVFTGFCSNFLWMAVGWFGFLVPFGRTEAGCKKRRGCGLLDVVGNNFSYDARSGTSFQWWTRRRWLCENLKYANSV